MSRGAGFRETALWRAGLAVAGALSLAAAACGAEAPPGEAGGAGSGGESAAAGAPSYPENLPYAKAVVSFTPGENAGFGEDALPGVALGPPQGKGTNAGSLDVVSLGVGGELVLGFEEHAIEDGEGPDFIVFENAFWPGGDRSAVYAEPARVSVSEDGEIWHAFPCDAAGDGAGRFAGCAGVSPALEFDPVALLPLDPELTGGDAFDLAELGLPLARFVKLEDLATEGDAPTAGFDFDALGVIAWR